MVYKGSRILAKLRKNQSPGRSCNREARGNMKTERVNFQGKRTWERQAKDYCCTHQYLFVRKVFLEVHIMPVIDHED